jgi:mannose/cellobiose epimerase-like protein (N-acyl-D-glucosamine 2-epimerase family)
MMAAFEATGDAAYLTRALTLAEAITQRQAALADTGHGALVWEHYRADWSVDWDYNRDDKTNIFRPWGFQTGHLTEWAKLLLQLERHLPADQRPAWLLPTAQRFFDTAMQRGWDHTHGGLVYGFAPDGQVCDADKYFWVQAESFAAAALLALRTGDATYWTWYERLWAYSWAHMIDHRHGAWFRIRTPDNRAYSDEKSPAGKTDYHTMGACYDVLRGLGA